MKEERYQKILDILSKDRFASVELLCRELYVSPPTVRRDLSAMQEMGYIVRSHGGAMLRDKDDTGTPLEFRGGVNSQDKLRLVKAAIQFLHEDMVIYLDESSTTFHIIDHLSEHRNIRVVTNSLSVLNRLYRNKIPAYCLGGELFFDNMSFVGRYAEDMIEHFGIDLMFFSSSGINRQGWIVDYCEAANSLRLQALKQAETKVFLCDKSKFLKRGAYTLMRLADVDYAIVSAPLPPEIATGSANIIIA